MGGRLWVESELGQGSRFIFTVRLAVDAAAPAVVPAPATLRYLPVLVVEDHAGQRQLLTRLLESWSMRPVATGPEEAVEIARKAAAAGQPFQLVLLDTSLPGRSSTALGVELRGHCAPGAGLVLLSSPRRTPGPDRSLLLGAHALVSKPVMASTLLETIQALLNDVCLPEEPAVAPLEAHQAVPPIPVRSLRILLAEDNAVNRKLVTRMLERAHHSVRSVDDGRKALAAMAEETFDVVLMDVQMPEMDGLEATRNQRAREQAHGGHIPVIALTAQAMSGDRDRCLAAGMDDYVSKPINSGELHGALQRVQSPQNLRPQA
jgi:two-component system sensor histidine kinase/response regulator